MKDVTRYMINQWEMNKMDWMGYSLEQGEHFSYHHLIIPKRYGGQMTVDNGAILIQSAGHDYLHIIERYDEKLFEELTYTLFEINQQRSMPTKEQLIRINQMLKYFEAKFGEERTKKGKRIIKQRYLRREMYG